ncbi:amidohydrolase family protein [uncultured Microscilla sp.]|uniref:amidohydrolase family protein n=1 Tax=uncultured Microscilla sp. TaxID=432653 RepID=UPI002635B8D3|nr:amidohydrolase family protein [uncultured Microscilla sp.]
MEENKEHKADNRRSALKKIAIAGTAAIFSPSILVGKDLSDQYKMVIKGGRVFTEGTLKSLEVGITQAGKIKLSPTPLEARKVINASGKIVSPGFIDILGDNASNPRQTYRLFEKYKVSDGVTTVLQMHGGAMFPKSFHNTFDRLPHYTNFGVSIFVMRLRLKYSLAQRYRYVEQGLEQGALAVAHSMEYQPDTTYAEVLQYAKLAKKYDRPLFLHLRYSDEKRELEGVKEAIRLAKESGGARVHIDHLHSTGGTFNMAKALELIQNANNMGLEITCCVYPYSYWATYIVSKRFAPGWRKRFGMTYTDLTVVGTGKKITAQTFPLYRKRHGVLVAVPEGTMPFEKTINLALQTDFCMIGSDGGIQSAPRANNHPRGAGCFATAVRHGMDIGMSLEKVLDKVTTLPGRLMRPSMNDRAVLKDGNIADVTVFDPKTIRGKASVANPNQFSEGIDTVIVNGEVAYQNKKLLKSAGKPIYYGK